MKSENSRSLLERYGLRSLRRTFGLTAFVVVTLALGIGLSTATFSMVDGLILRPYPVPNPGNIVNGHWEIHPVEKVETIDNGPHFLLGPLAEYVKWPTHGNGTIAGRYKVTDDNFADAEGQMKVSNYAKLIGNVKHIRVSSNGSGDVDVDLEVNSHTYIATIPQYYVKNFDADTETLEFQQLEGFKSVNYTLKPSDAKPQTFYGLRNWRFSDGEITATLAPVEMIK